MNRELLNDVKYLQKDIINRLKNNDLNLEVVFKDYAGKYSEVKDAGMEEITALHNEIVALINEKEFLFPKDEILLLLTVLA
jgi:hypothetical protein